MEGGDLVIVQISRNESLSGKAASDVTNMRAGQAQFIQTIKVGRGVIAHGGHDQRLTAEQHQIVGNVAGTAAIFTAQFRHQKSNVQDVNLLRQDVIFETVRKDHDVVKGERTAN